METAMMKYFGFMAFYVISMGVLFIWLRKNKEKREKEKKDISNK